MKIFSVAKGDSPVILAQPHGGIFVPDDIWPRLNDNGKALADTDWHINQLYDGLLDNATVVQSHIHRYVIDANRDPQDKSLYPGQNTTSLCPLTDFDGKAIYKCDQEPAEDEIQQRQILYHQPYHDALASEIERVRQLHGSVILYDCHSIRSKIPFLFEGTLPNFNIGTYDGRSCSQAVAMTVKNICNQAKDHSHIVNGRFKGGWTTRHYGQPSKGIHAIQMELAQSTYMQESTPWSYDENKANRLRLQLNKILTALTQLSTDL